MPCDEKDGGEVEGGEGGSAFSVSLIIRPGNGRSRRGALSLGVVCGGRVGRLPGGRQFGGDGSADAVGKGKSRHLPKNVFSAKQWLFLLFTKDFWTFRISYFSAVDEDWFHIIGDKSKERIHFIGLFTGHLQLRGMWDKQVTTPPGPTDATIDPPETLACPLP